MNVIKEELEQIYNWENLKISQEAETDLQVMVSCVCKDKTGPISDEEKTCWNHVYQNLNKMDIDALYENVKFMQGSVYARFR